jgi:hypothetical protein
MAIIQFTGEEKFGAPLENERHVLEVFRGELAEEGRRETAKYVLPLIDRRLQEITDERACRGLEASDPIRYAESVRDGEEELAQIAAQLRRDEENRI